MERRRFMMTAGSLMLLAYAPGATASKQYGPGVSDTEIKIGSLMPYSGPASAYGTIGRVQAAYFQSLNDKGGINGRKVSFISHDDGYSPPRALEMARRLVERDRVLLVFQVLGTPSNIAIQNYLNSQKVPQLFAASGASRWNDPSNFPWTMGWAPSLQKEGEIYGRHIVENRPNAKIAVLYQNDDYGRDYLTGFQRGLGPKASQIVASASYEVTDPNVDSQIAQFKGADADVFFNVTTMKFAAMAIRRAHDIGWKPVQYLNSISASIGAALLPAGAERSKGIISAQFFKDPLDDRWDADRGMLEWKEFMAKYYANGDIKDAYNVYGYAAAQTLAHVLQQCGDNLTRENVMKQAASIQGWRSEVFLPGVMVNTSASDFAPIESLQLIQFDGEKFNPLGDVIEE